MKRFVKSIGRGLWNVTASIRRPIIAACDRHLGQIIENVVRAEVERIVTRESTVIVEKARTDTGHVLRVLLEENARSIADLRVGVEQRFQSELEAALGRIADSNRDRLHEEDLLLLGLTRELGRLRDRIDGDEADTPRVWNEEIAVA